MPQLAQPQRASQLHHLREDVVHRSPVALAKLVQRPKIRLCPSRQIAKRQIFSDALLQPPRTGHPQRVGIQPHLQQQRRMIRRMSFVAVALLELTQVQLLYRAMHEKAKMPCSQHFSHCGWQQISLLRVVLQKIGHPALLLSRQYKGSVKPSCHTDSYTISAKIRNQFVVFVSDGVRSGLRRFGSNSATPLAAAPLGAALRLPGGMQTETHATGCGFSVSGKE